VPYLHGQVHAEGEVMDRLPPLLLQELWARQLRPNAFDMPVVCSEQMGQVTANMGADTRVHFGRIIHEHKYSKHIRAFTLDRQQRHRKVQLFVTR
jgi:hypothetical protein